MTEVKIRKAKKMSDTRMIPGAELLRAQIEKALNFREEIAKFDLMAEKVAEALNISKEDAANKLKLPEGFTDTLTLRKYIRLAVTRPEVATDVIVLARIAQVVAENISEGMLIVPREKVKTANTFDIES